MCTQTYGENSIPVYVRESINPGLIDNGGNRGEAEGSGY